MSVKSVIKELLIFILLTAIVILVLLIIFTDFFPSEEIVQPISYVASSNVKATLEEVTTSNAGGESENTTPLLKSYTVDKSDLKVYQTAQSYHSGKSNPFIDLEKEQYNENAVDPSLGTGSSVTNSVQGTTSSGSSSSSTPGTFFEGSTK